MKKITLLLFFILILIPTMASAHTALTSSSPEEGEVVQGSLNEVSVQFETEIEEISTIKLIKEDQEIPFQEVKVESQQMIGKLKEPLANGTYTIQWTIVGEDGHPISGEIPFLVKGTEPAVDSNSSEQDQNTKEEIKDETKEESNKEKQDNETEESSSPFVLVLIVAFTIILGVSIGLIFKKKR
ncbi:copper resistance protein CopC [Metabacillus idriensis]|uniref:copper resistance CopC family protein n=1 Tax=Metabacillus idriensis TaxID=324768 RepID=UPI00174870D9|nr:copper resistance CopC family protein [Metabacillus idriensis]